MDDLYKSSAAFSKDCRLLNDIRDQYCNIDLRSILDAPNGHILTVFKLMMLEGKVIVYSQNARRLTQYCYSLLGLFPGLLTFDFS